MSEALVTTEAPQHTRPEPLRPEPLYAKLRPRPNGPGHEAVANHQRARLYGAIIERVAGRGYAAITMTELCKLAGVSTRTAYQLFVSKQAYFIVLAPVIGGEAAVQVILACEEQPNL
jgi:AcrR family transcriptional regulator